jgi:3-phenylpropionate/trans-cinnamate dioxygenase ferredoxin component
MSFVKACALADVPEEGAFAVEIEDTPVVVARIGEEIFALRDVCSHAEVALSEGDVEDCTIECWLHGSRFDLRTGKPTGLPATEPVATFPIEVRADGVYIDVTTTLNGVSPS